MEIKEDFDNLISVSANCALLKIHKDVPISSLTTMRLGGAACYETHVKTPAEIPCALDYASERKLPVWIMGAGANTIGTDEGYNGIILHSEMTGIKILSEHDNKILIRANAGEIWDDLVDFATTRGYSGIEAMSLIPGTVGAAPVQNIGAYGQDIASVLKAVYAYDSVERKFVLLDQVDELAMDYRCTYFNHGEGEKYIIFAIAIELTKGNLKPPFYASLQRYIDEHHETDFSPQNIRRMVCEIRRSKLPDPEFEASAGSFFKNIIIPAEQIREIEERGIPVWHNSDGTGKVNAGWLIEHSGLKGENLFGFQVSDKAALILINRSATSYADLARARQKIIDTVEAKFGFRLEQEPVEIPARPAYDPTLGIAVNYKKEKQK